MNTKGGKSQRSGNYLKLILLVLIVLSGVYYLLFHSRDIRPTIGHGAKAESAGGPLNSYGADVKVGAVSIFPPSSAKVSSYIKEKGVEAVAISTKGRYIATAKKSEITIWKYRAFRARRLFKLRGNISDIDSISFSFDERYLVSLGDTDQRVDIWDVEKRKLMGSEEIQPVDESFSIVVTVRNDRCSLEVNDADYVLEVWKGEVDILGKRMPSSSSWLRDRISGIYLMRGDEFSKASSWSESGRYIATGRPDGVIIWKLCGRAKCRFPTLERWIQ